MKDSIHQPPMPRLLKNSINLALTLIELFKKSWRPIRQNHPLI